MPANFLHGVETIEIDDGPRPIRLVKTAVIGLVGTAPIFQVDVDNRTVNEPVLILNDSSAATLFGTSLAGYTIPQAIDAILDQQVNGSGAGAIIVVNVFDPARHKSSVEDEAKTFDATDTLTLDHVGVASLVLKNQDGSTTYTPGADYAVNAATGVVTRVAGGAIPVAGQVSAAYDHADPSKVTAADIIGAVDLAGNRTGMQAFKDCLGLFGYNPKVLIAPAFSPLASVTSALDVLAQALRAMALADAPVGATFQQALAGRGANGGDVAFNSSSERLVFCYPYCKVYDTTLAADRLEPYSQRLAGVMAATDLEKGYWWSPSNREIQGIDGMERKLTAAINDPGSEVNALNEAGVTTLFNAYGTGLRTWGNRSAAWPTETHPKNFINIRRVADVIAESIEYSMLQFLDQPITNGWIDAVTESVNSFLRTLIGRGALINGKCWYDPAKNQNTELALGHITFSYDFMPPPPAERISFESRVNINYLAELGSKTYQQGA